MKKVWGSLMACSVQDGNKRQQRRVIMFGHLKDFMAATGITRDYISDTGNEKEVAAATANPGVLLGEVGREFSKEFMPLDESEAQK